MSMAYLIKTIDNKIINISLSSILDVTYNTSKRYDTFSIHLTNGIKYICNKSEYYQLRNSLMAVNKFIELPEKSTSSTYQYIHIVPTGIICYIKYDNFKDTYTIVTFNNTRYECSAKSNDKIKQLYTEISR